MGRRTEEHYGTAESSAILLPREPINNKAATEENSLLFAHGATLSDDIPFNYEECLSKVSGPSADSIDPNTNSTCMCWL